MDSQPAHPARCLSSFFNALVFSVTAIVAITLLSVSASAQIIGPDDDPILTCRLLPDGLSCPDREDTAGDCVTPVCRAGRCQQEPVDRAIACRDTDGDPLTSARCEAGTGRCDQRAIAQSQYTSGVPKDVDVLAHNLDELAESTSEVDCGLCCEAQHLEALRIPTNPTDPIVRVTGDLPAVRAKFCGTVVDYGVFDENKDPRDILLNIVPDADFRAFVRPFENTQCDDDGLQCIHAEITPAQQFYEQDTNFLPIASSGRCSDGGTNERDCESVFERLQTPVCVYGPYAIDHGSHSSRSHEDLSVVLDSSHDHPEIHPIDALWWRRSLGNGYNFAVFQDDSNRYSAPYCTDGGGFFSAFHNSNGWSQAPRDMQFAFPFSFALSQAPVRAEINRLITRNFAGETKPLTPLNVSTSMQVNSSGESNRSLTIDGEIILEVIENLSLDSETEVSVQGEIVNGNRVEGQVNVRVAVGCDTREPTSTCSITRLREASPQGQHDAADAGSGYYLGEIKFSAAPAPGTIDARVRFLPSGDTGRVNLLIDGTVVANNLGNGSTGRVSFPAGTHRVSQRQVGNTQLLQYRSSFTGNCNAAGTIALTPGQNAVCTITNRRITSNECEDNCKRDRDICKADGEDTAAMCAIMFNQCKARCP